MSVAPVLFLICMLEPLSRKHMPDIALSIARCATWKWCSDVCRYLQSYSTDYAITDPLGQVGEILEMVNGKHILLVNGYPYYKKNLMRSGLTRFCCRKASCNVYLHVDDGLRAVHSGNFPHNHPPKKFYRTVTGRYKRVWNDPAVECSGWRKF